MAPDRLTDELLIRGLGDWLHWADVEWVAQRFGASADAVGVGVEAIAQLLDDGLIEAGDVTDGGFVAWDLTPAAAADRIEREWHILGRPAVPGDVGWLANTPRGDARARQIGNRYRCPVCGYPELQESPWSDDAGSDEICPSCGTHFGYDDAAGGDAARREARHRELRAEWVAAGCPWFSPGQPSPLGWDPQRQLSAVEE